MEILPPKEMMKNIKIESNPKIEVETSKDYEKFKKEIVLYELKKKTGMSIDQFFENYKVVSDAIAGGYGVVNIVYSESKQNLLAVKAISDNPRKWRELYWLWKFEEHENFVKMKAFFETDKRPPSEWMKEDASNESVWRSDNLVFIVTPFYPYCSYDFFPKIKKKDFSSFHSNKNKDEKNTTTSTKTTNRFLIPFIPTSTNIEKLTDSNQNITEETSSSSSSPPLETLRHLTKNMKQIYEKLKYDLPSQRAWSFDSKEIVAFIFEIFATILGAREASDSFQHLDLKMSNIMIKPFKQARYYDLEKIGQRVTVKTGYKPVIIDLGVSEGPWTRNRMTPEKSRDENFRKPNAQGLRVNTQIDVDAILNILYDIIDRNGKDETDENVKNLYISLNNFVKKFPRVADGYEKDLLEKMLNLPEWRHGCFFQDHNFDNFNNNNKLQMNSLTNTTNTIINNRSISSTFSFENSITSNEIKFPTSGALVFVSAWSPISKSPKFYQF